MGWQDNIENVVFTIKTGDGKVFTPLWKDSEKTKEYNTSTYDFIDVQGSFVDRKKAKSSKYPLQFWFQGTDNIEQSNEFENSADDSRSWEITHPFYGTIIGQPISISRNDKAYNVTEINVDFWETIGQDYPKSNVSIVDETAKKNNEVMQSAVISYSSKDNVLSSEDITKNKDANILTNDALGSELENDDFADYQVIFAAAQKSTDRLLDDAETAIFNTQKLLFYPSTTNKSAIGKTKSYIFAFKNLVKDLITIADKLFFESQGASCISNYCNASVNYIQGDYSVRTEVEETVSNLVQIYNEYLETLDNASVSIYNTDSSWNPNVDLQNDLNNLVVFTISNLFILAFSAKQERIIYTDKDSNLILLTHKYLGLDSNDENIEKFREVNNIKLEELLNVKKGRKIKYYV